MPLPQTGIDTGMGLERLATLVQNVDSIYEIDEMKSFVDYVSKKSGKEYSGDNIMPINVLVVDDSGVMRSMIIKSIRMSGLVLGDVYEAANGQEGLEKLKSNPVDLVVADINMPVMDGEEMIDRMKADSDTLAIPVVVISTEGSEERQERLMSGLESTVDIMQEIGLETAEYRQLMIQATGDITADIFDKDVALGLLDTWFEGVKKWTADNGPRVIFKAILFVLIILLFKILARFTRRIVTASVSHSKLQFSQLLQNMFVSMLSRRQDHIWLTYLVAPPDESLLQEFNAKGRHMWCTGGFLRAAGLAVTRSGDIVPLPQAGDAAVLSFDPIRISCSDEGVTEWSHEPESTQRYIFHVRDIDHYQTAMTRAMRTLLQGLP